MPENCTPENLLYFSQPAERFDRALPLGNGRLGAMVYGQPAQERLLLNESGMWSGSPEDSDRQDAAQYLPEIRRLLAAGENKKAEELFLAHFTCLGQGTARGGGAEAPYGCYQLLGWLTLSTFYTLSFAHKNYDHMDEYRRELDISTAVATVRFPGDGVQYTREYLASAADEAIAVRLAASQPGCISLGIGLERPERRKVEAVGDDTLLMHGALPNGTGGDGVRYACAVRVAHSGGTLHAEDGRLYLRGADEAVLYISAATSLAGFAGSRAVQNVKQKALDEAEAARAKGWPAVKKAHIEDYTALFNRASLCFEKDPAKTAMDLADRVRAAEKHFDDTGLAELYYNYSRYLLISCSREGRMPADLQGIWAEEVQTPWNGDWHLNAQQMIYWTAERANLAGSHLPFLELSKDLAGPGSKTARAYYNAEGWVVHTCTNTWGFTSPCEDATWGSTIGSAAWQCHHLWEHYLFTKDEAYLRAAYPAMKQAALFYRDILVEEPRHGWLVTSPSSSPENTFFTPEDDECGLCMGPAYDTQLLRSLFAYCIDAAAVLGGEDAFAEELRGLLARMAPIEVGSDGRIKEWLEEYDVPRPYHRHLSHLWGLYPGLLINPETTPELAKAAEKSLLARGTTTAGWAIAYRMCVWARLRSAEKAWHFLAEALRCATAYNLFNLAFHCDETLEVPTVPDIENGRYPFQIDGNMGIATGILLMLMDDRLERAADGSEVAVITLLPALPAQLAAGSAKGICAMGGFEVDFAWRAGKVTAATVRSAKGGRCAVEMNGARRALTLAAGESATL